MAIQTISGGLWLPPGYGTGASSPAFGSNTQLNAAAIRSAVVFRVPKSGTLDGFEWRQNDNTNTPDNGLRFMFMDVNASGNPDNVQDQFRLCTSGFGVGAWLVPDGVMTDDGTNGGVKRTVTKGDFLACVVRLENFVAGDSLAMSSLILSGVIQNEIDVMQRYTVGSSDSGGTWGKSSTGTAQAVALKYSDGTYGVLGFPWHPAQTINNRTFNNGSSPDERGLLFQVPVACALQGGWLRASVSGAFDVVLYDNSGTTLATVSIGVNQVITTSGADLRFYFSSSQVLTPNVNYRLTVRPSSGSNVTTYDFDIANSAILSGIDGGSTWMSTNRTDAGAFTDVNTNRPYMGLIFDGFDDGAGGSGGAGSSVLRGGRTIPYRTGYY